MIERRTPQQRVCVPLTCSSCSYCNGPLSLSSLVETLSHCSLCRCALASYSSPVRAMVFFCFGFSLLFIFAFGVGFQNSIRNSSALNSPGATLTLRSISCATPSSPATRAPGSSPFSPALAPFPSAPHSLQLSPPTFPSGKRLISTPGRCKIVIIINNFWFEL